MSYPEWYSPETIEILEAAGKWLDGLRPAPKPQPQAAPSAPFMDLILDAIWLDTQRSVFSLPPPPKPKVGEVIYAGVDPGNGDVDVWVISDDGKPINISSNVDGYGVMRDGDGEFTVSGGAQKARWKARCEESNESTPPLYHGIVKEVT